MNQRKESKSRIQKAFFDYCKHTHTGNKNLKKQESIEFIFFVEIINRKIIQSLRDIIKMNMMKYNYRLVNSKPEKGFF